MKNFITTDMGLATVLQTTGFKLNGLDRSDLSRIRFLFEHEEGLDQVLAQHYQNELRVSSLTLLSNYRLLKNTIYQK